MPTYTKEGDVKKEIKRLLKEHGWYHWMPPSNAYGVAGQSDHLALRSGVFLAVEAKLYPKKPTPLQVIFLKKVAAHEGIALSVNQHTLPHFATWLRLFDVAAQCQADRTPMDPADDKEFVNAFGHLTEYARTPTTD